MPLIAIACHQSQFHAIDRHCMPSIAISLSQAEMAAAAAAAQLSIDEREATILALRASVTEYVIELRGLTDIKLALDAEIATYKRLLAGEESRYLITSLNSED